MLPGGLGDAGQAGDCVKQFQYVYRVFEHCRVRQATRRVGGGGSNPEPHTVFFSDIFKFGSQNAYLASGNEIQQRKKAVKERRGC